MASDLPYLRSYPAFLQDQARDLLSQGRLGDVLQRKYPQAHAVRSDKALYDYAQELKARYLRNAGTAILVISEELDELFEISDRIAVIAKGRLSPAKRAADTNVEEIGVWMSGMWPGATTTAAPTRLEVAHA